MNLELADDKKLKDDVRKCFLKYSTDIEIVDEVMQFERFKLKDNYDRTINLFEFYTELYKWKRRAQLRLNLHNNYEFYRNLENGEKIPKLTEDIYNHDSCVANWKPNKNDVIEALYRYVLYFLIIQCEERRNYFNEMVGNDGLDSVKCNVCGNLIEICNLKCSLCQEPVEETIRSIDELNSVQLNSVKVSKYEGKEINSDIPTCGIESEENEMINGQTKMNKCEANIDINLAWECEKCEEINKNENISCVKCENPRREGWTCQHCTAYNDKQINQCIACNHDNDVIDEKYCDRCGDYDVIRDGLCNDCLIRLRWKCWYRFCMNENIGDDKYCKYCGLDRNADRKNVTTVWRCKDGIEDQIWICDKCDLINENCMNFICDNCGVARNNAGDEGSNMEIDSIDKNLVNEKQFGWRCEKCQFLNGSDLSICVNCSSPRFWTCRKCYIENKISNKKCIACNQKREFCKKCKKNEIIVDKHCEICLAVVLKWKCSHELCKEKNYSNDKYCTNCGLDRSHMKIHGAPVSQRCGTVIVEKWICGECHAINDQCANYCVKLKCLTGRKLHKRCHKCGCVNINNLINLNCVSCKRLL